MKAFILLTSIHPRLSTCLAAGTICLAVCACCFVACAGAPEAENAGAPTLPRHFITGRHHDYPPVRFLVGTGEGPSAAAAEAAAKSAVSRQISSRLQSRFESFIQEAGGQFEALATEEIRQQTTYDHAELIEVRERHLDPGNGAYYALATLEREKAAGLLDAELRSHVLDFEHHAGLARQAAGVADLEALDDALKTARTAALRADHLLLQKAVVLGRMELFSDHHHLATLQELERLRGEARERLEWLVWLQGDAASAARRAGIPEEIFTILKEAGLRARSVTDGETRALDREAPAHEPGAPLPESAGGRQLHPELAGKRLLNAEILARCASGDVTFCRTSLKLKAHILGRGQQLLAIDIGGEPTKAGHLTEEKALVKSLTKLRALIAAPLRHALSKN